MKLLKSLLLKNNKGVAAIEFALVAPVLILLTYGILEVTRYTYFHQKVADSSSQLMNILNQNLQPNRKEISLIFDASKDIMLPFEELEYVMIVSAMRKNNSLPNNKLTVEWQLKEGKEAEGSPNLDSEIAPKGKGSKVDIEGLTVRERDQIITVELFTKYQPMLNAEVFFSMGFARDYIYKSSMARPRYGAFNFEPK